MHNHVSLFVCEKGSIAFFFLILCPYYHVHMDEVFFFQDSKCFSVST
jgi:hypothetical protein